MIRFSANLGFLWTDRPLGDAIHAAAQAGFAAVECHWPYDFDPAEVRAVLDDTGMPMLALNTRPGDRDAGDMGLSAVPGRQVEAREAIAEAVEYASAVGAGAVHVMAGKASGTAAHDVFLENLDFACGLARDRGLEILIEPLNEFDAPGYFLGSTGAARAILAEVGSDTAKLMFDCYHVGRTEGDVRATLARCWADVGHIQFAGVPDRGAPDRGHEDYRAVFADIAAKGWGRPLGAEFRPTSLSAPALDWMETLQP